MHPRPFLALVQRQIIHPHKRPIPALRCVGGLSCWRPSERCPHQVASDSAGKDELALIASNCWFGSIETQISAILTCPAMPVAVFRLSLAGHRGWGRWRHMHHDHLPGLSIHIKRGTMHEILSAAHTHRPQISRQSRLRPELLLDSCGRRQCGAHNH